jgi:hypothetical protein
MKNQWAHWALSFALCGLLASGSVALASPVLLDPTNVPEDSFGVDLRDVIKYRATLFSTAQVLAMSIRAEPGRFVEAQISYSVTGPGVSRGSRADTIFGVEITALEFSEVHKNTPEYVVLSILYHTSAAGLRVRHVRVQIRDEAVVAVEALQDISIGDLKFQLQVSLVERKILLRAEEQGVFKIYPVGVGGFDESVRTPGVKIVTDSIPDAVVDPRLMAEVVNKPAYFMGRPFIVITRSSGQRTGLGFHYSINQTLQRGFVSHGCMRMVDKDLYELFTILDSNRKQPITLSIHQSSDVPFDHPYPLVNDRYYSVKNFGSIEKPVIRRDSDGLVIMNVVRRPPPVESLNYSWPLSLMPGQPQLEPWATESSSIPIYQGL